MNNPNPLIPQGSLLEQQAKAKPHLRIALFIVAVHVVFLGLLLMQGCKREAGTLEMAETSTNDFPLGIPEPRTLFASNTVSELPMGQEPVMGGRGTDGAVAQGGVESPPTGVTTNAGGAAGAVFVPEPAPDVPPPAPQLVAREHVVAPGETFYTIAKKYGVTSAAIASANPNVDPNRLPVKQRLIIPPPAPAGVTPAPAEALPAGLEWYKVQPGDTLTKIAKARGTTAAAIRELNAMTTDRIYVNQKLKMPARTNAAAVNP